MADTKGTDGNNKRNEAESSSSSSTATPSVDARRKMSVDHENKQRQAQESQIVLDVETIRELKNLFAMFDINNDGVLSVKEFTNMLLALGEDTTDVKKTMQDIDPGGGGVVRLNKVFLKNMGKKLFLDMRLVRNETLSNADIEKSFLEFDKDQNGFISSSELIDMIEKHAKNFAEDDKEACIENIKSFADRNGRIHYEQFLENPKPKKSKDPSNEQLLEET